MASTTEMVLMEETDLLSTTEEGPTVLGYPITGLELTLFYMTLNVLMLFVILIKAWRSGKRKVKEKRNKKRAESRERVKSVQEVRDEEKYEGHASIEMGVAGAAPGHVDQIPSSEQIERQLSDLSGKDKISEFCNACIGDIMGRSFIYSAFLVHVWDQGSDIGVIYTWFTEDEGKWTYLGWISIGVLLNYRIFSAYSLRRAQRGWRDTILQSLDLQLFVDVYRSTEDAKPTDSLYWIRAMEAVLESCLQILLQFVYLYEKTDFFVWLSLFGSMASVIFSLMHYTDVIFLGVNGGKGITFWISYVTRFMFRACEVTSRCMVLALIWSTWNSTDHEAKRGTAIVGVILGVEAIFFGLLTQFRIPPWEIAAFLVVNIDLVRLRTVGFESVDC